MTPNSTLFLVSCFWHKGAFTLSDTKTETETDLDTDKLTQNLRARLHLAIATPLWWRCNIAPKSNVCIWSCTVTYSICNCDCNIAGGSLQEWHRCNSGVAVAVAVCKWVLMGIYIGVCLSKVWTTPHNFVQATSIGLCIRLSAGQCRHTVTWNTWVRF